MSAPFEPKKFAILRIEKIKDMATLAAHSNHITRASPTANADPDMPPPTILVGSGNPRVDVLDALATVPGKRRKNAVIAVEIFLSASPDWLRNGRPPGSFDTYRTALLASAAKIWFTEQFGANGISLVMHLDESTPHFHATFCPIDDTPSATGKAAGRRLNAGRWFDGPEKLAKLQDSWAAATAELGLERGIKGSVARHDKVRHLYGRMEQDQASAAHDATKSAALRAGIEAWSDGRIIGASQSQNGKIALKLAPMPADERLALNSAIRPAFSDVWRFICRMDKLIAKRAEVLLTETRDKAAALAAATEAHVRLLLIEATALKGTLSEAGKLAAARAATLLDRRARRATSDAKGRDAR